MATSKQPSVALSVLATTAMMLSAAVVHAQAPAQEIPAQAAERLRHIVGTWDNRWERLDDNGEVVDVIHGSMTAVYSIDDRVVETTTYSNGSTSKVWQFYSLRDELYYQVSVSGNGDLWTMSGPLDEWVVTSLPKRVQGDREVIIRFTHFNIQEDSFEAIQEVSFDNGATWTKRMHEYVTRRTGTVPPG